MRPLAAGLFDLPAGIERADLAWISERVAIIAAVFAVIGILLLRKLAGRSISFMVAIVVAVCTLTSMAGIGVIANRMVGTPSERNDMLDLMAIAGLAGLAVALFVGRRLTKASRALSSAVQNVGESGVYMAPQLTLPAELKDLSAELTATHERLAQARSRERALEASRRELVAWVSHDLRTPLAGLRAMAEALEDQVVVDPREVSTYHSQIRREVDRLTLMIDDLFELSRIHAGALRLSKRMVGLEDLVAEVVASTDPVARSKGVRLTGAAVRGMPVYVDAAEMGRALRNLVTNAIRHTPSDGGVEVLAEVQSGMACVSVSDACGGIPPGDLTAGVRRGVPRRVGPHPGAAGGRRPRPVHRARHRRGALRPDRRAQRRTRLPVPDQAAAGPRGRPRPQPHRPPPPHRRPHRPHPGHPHRPHAGRPRRPRPRGPRRGGAAPRRPRPHRPHPHPLTPPEPAGFPPRRRAHACFPPRRRGARPDRRRPYACFPPRQKARPDRRRPRPCHYRRSRRLFTKQRWPGPLPARRNPARLVFHRGLRARCGARAHCQPAAPPRAQTR